jgi:hypothetical protein
VIYWLATFPHYLRHLQPILDELEARGHQLSQGVGDVTLTAGRVDSQKAHTARRLILVEHGAGQTYMYKGRRVDAGDAGPDGHVTLYLAPNRGTADFTQTLLPNADCVVIGCPALERLSSRMDGPRNKIVFAVHWASSLAGKVREAGTSWPWSAHILRELAKIYPGMVTATGHPRIAYQVKRGLLRRQINVPLVESWDELAPQTRVLVCDNSSIIWEASALRIPVVLIHPADWVDGTHGLRFGVEADRFGRITDWHDAVGSVKAAVPSEGPAIFDVVEGATRLAVDAIEAHVG